MTPLFWLMTPFKGHGDSRWTFFGPFTREVAVAQRSRARVTQVLVFRLPSTRTAGGCLAGAAGPRPQRGAAQERAGQEGLGGVASVSELGVQVVHERKVIGTETPNPPNKVDRTVGTRSDTGHNVDPDEYTPAWSLLLSL